MGLGIGGDHICLGADARLSRFLCGTSRNLDSPDLSLDPSVIFAPACWAERVGETGDPRRGCEGIPRAEARLLAMDEDSRLGIRGIPGSFGGWF